MATTASTMTEALPTHSLTASGGDDQVNELPIPLQRSSTMHNPSPGFSHRHRHSKKLSLSFPILVPVMHDAPLTGTGSLSSLSQSPVVPSPYRNGTPVSGMPLPSPEQLQETESPDFLTLIAGQERRVMELKEELQKAESLLQGLKKQWAVFEAKKKHAELRTKTVRLGPVSPQTAGANAEDEEADRVRRREAREKKMKDLALKEAGIERSNSSGSKGKGGRVFAGRHTRTLSLLQNNATTASDLTQDGSDPKARTDGNPAVSQPSDSPATISINPEQNGVDTKRHSRASLSRQATLQELIANSATGSAQLNFGKTYKDLASASRKSLPPGTDVFVKQGKQVYEGLNQGFWNFVEDIRQATVGDEPVHGTPTEPRKELRKPKSSKKTPEPNCERHGKPGAKQNEKKKKIKQSDEHKGEKDNFWKEFGLETPKGSKALQSDSSKAATTVKAKETTGVIKDHESKSSTDSKCPPSLLADLMDVNDDDEAWDNWPVDSPSAKWLASSKVRVRNTSEDEDSDEAEDENNAKDSRPDDSTKLMSRNTGSRPVKISLPELSD